MITGFNDIVRLRFDNGMELRCTPVHKIFTANRGYVEAAAPHLRRRGQGARPRGPGGRRRPRRCRCPRTRPTTGPRATTRMPLRFPDMWTDGVRPLPRLAHRRRQHVGHDRGHHLRERRGPRRDPPRPRRAARLGQLRAPDQGLRAGQRHGPAAAGPPRLQAVPRGPRRAVGQGPREDASRGRSSRRRPRWWRRSCGACSTPTGASVTRAKGSLRRVWGRASPELLRGVQTLLTTFGIMSRVYQTRVGVDEGLVHATPTRRARRSTYGHSASYDLRITSGSIVALRPAHRLLAVAARRRCCGAWSSSAPKGPYDGRDARPTCSSGPTTVSS